MQFLNVQGSVVKMMHSVNRIEQKPCLCSEGKIDGIIGLAAA